MPSLTGVALVPKTESRQIGYGDEVKATSVTPGTGSGVRAETRRLNGAGNNILGSLENTRDHVTQVMVGGEALFLNLVFVGVREGAVGHGGLLLWEMVRLLYMLFSNWA